MNLQATAPTPTQARTAIRLVQPEVRHGAAIHELIAACKPLDLNSTYLYLLLAHHFAQTCILALEGEVPMGFVSAYRPPGRPDTLFVWQVAVRRQARGQGLGRRMLEELLARDALRGVTRLETTVSPSNEASLAMFHSLARALGAPMSNNTLFTREDFGADAHEPERLIAIGPFRTPAIPQETR